MNIFVGNLSIEITEAELRLEFLSFGQVTAVTIMSDQGIGSGQGRQCAYVEMPSTAEGEDAIEKLQGKSIKGRPLDIIKSLPATRISGSRLSGEVTVMGFTRKPNSNRGRKKRTV
jgi:RNA recognition motif-containing protein